jgi:hypothetical protein
MLYSSIDGYGYIEALSSKFPVQARKCLNAGAWQDFERSTGKPTIEMPDPTVHSSEVPPVHEHQYGICAVTSEVLFAFGVVAVRSIRYSGEPYFEVKWFQNREDAEAVRVQSENRLSVLKRELAEQKVVADMRTKAAVVKSSAASLYNRCDWSDSDGMKNCLYPIAYGFIPSDFAGLRKWIDEAEVIVNGANRIVEAYELRRNRPEIREVRIDRRGQYCKPELNGSRIDRPESFRFTPAWFWDDLLALVEQNGRNLTVFAIYRGTDPLVLAMTRAELEFRLSIVEDAVIELGVTPTDGARTNFWRKLEGVRPKQKVVELSRPKFEPERSIPNPQTKSLKGGSSGFGTDAWGALDALKL